LIKCKDLNSL